MTGGDTKHTDTTWTRRAARIHVLSHEIDFKNVDENEPILALIRAAAGF
jgi:hypothetical protein